MPGGHQERRDEGREGSSKQMEKRTELVSREILKVGKALQIRQAKNRPQDAVITRGEVLGTR